MAKARHIREPARDVPVFDQYDVVVVGGGIAGVAASVAAAREGARTALIEYGFGLGGLATLGNIIVYLPLCDGNGRKVSGGLAEELLKLAIKQGDPLHAPGGYDIPDCWKPSGDKARRTEERYKLAYNAESYRLALETFVLRAEVDLLYGMRFCDVSKKRGRIEAILVESKSGRVALRCRAVVDASGDGDVCAHAGEPTITCNMNVAAARPRLTHLDVQHGKSGHGLGIDFDMRQGAVTLLNLTQFDAGETFKLIYSVAEVIPGDVLHIGNPNCRVRVTQPIHEFMEAWCQQGPAHHVALGRGDLGAAVEAFAEGMGFRCVRV